MGLTGNIGSQRVAVGGYIDSTKAMRDALTGVNSTLQANRLRDDKLAQEAIANQRAADRLAISQAQEGRAVTDWDKKNMQDEALRMSMLNPLTSNDPNAGKGTLLDTASIQVNERIAADYTANPEAFMKQYGTDKIVDGAMVQSPASLDLQQSVTQAGQRETGVVDPKDYMRRMTDNAVSMGADPVASMNAANARATMLQQSAPSTKASREAAKATYTVEKDLVSKQMNMVDKMYGKNRKGASSAKKSYGGVRGKADLMVDMRTAFPNDDWSLGSDTAMGGASLQKTLKGVLSDKAYNVDDVYAAVMMNASGVNDSWLDKDAEVQIQNFEKTLAQFTAERASTGGSSAQKALDGKYKADMEALQGRLAASGKAYTNSLSGTSSTALTSQEFANRVMPSFYGAEAPAGAEVNTNKPPKVPTETIIDESTLTDEEKKEVAKEKPAIAKVVGKAYTTYGELQASKEYASLSPAGQLLTDIGYGFKSTLDVVGGTLADAGTGLRNTATAAGNLFRPSNSPTPYVSLDDGRAEIKEGAVSAKDNLSEFVNSATIRPSDYARTKTPKGQEKVITQEDRMNAMKDSNAALDARMEHYRQASGDVRIVDENQFGSGLGGLDDKNASGFSRADEGKQRVDDDKSKWVVQDGQERMMVDDPKKPLPAEVTGGVYIDENNKQFPAALLGYTMVMFGDDYAFFKGNRAKDANSTK